jgi:hypothetical protein
MTTAKNTPTPKRKDAQKRNFQPIVRDSQTKKMGKEEKKAYKKQRREENRAARIRQQEALRTGDERYLPARDQGAVRRFVRDSVDASWTLAQLFLPIAIVALFISSLFLQYAPEYAATITVAVYAFILVAVVQMVFRVRRLKRILVDKFGEVAIQKGSGNIAYAVNRMIQPKIARLPKPTPKAELKRNDNRSGNK